jgi:preprotein translocase subunit SecF
MSKLSGLGNRLYTGETSINVIGRKKIWYAFSGFLVALSFVALATQGLKLGIEFKGGASYTVTKH